MEDYIEYYYNDWAPWTPMVREIKTVLIEDGVTSIGEDAFANLEYLETVVISDTVKTIGSGAFMRCCNMSALSIGNGVKSIGEGAFQDCEDLLTVYIPDSVQTIGSSAFYNCGISEVFVGSSVSSIGGFAFFRGMSASSCNTPLAMYFEADAPTVNKAGDYYSYPSFTSNLTTLYYVPGTEGWTDSEAYDAATGRWNGYTLKVWEERAESGDDEAPEEGEDAEEPEEPEQPEQPEAGDTPEMGGIFAQLIDQYPADGERNIVNTKKKELVISMTFDYAVEDVSDHGKFRIYAVDEDGDTKAVYKLDKEDVTVYERTVEIDVSDVVFENKTQYMIYMDKEVVVFEDELVVAEIEEQQWMFTTGETSCEIEVDTDGDGDVKGDGHYRLGDEVELTAKADDGAEFEGWYDEDGDLISKEEEIEIDAEEDLELTAKFSEEKKKFVSFVDVNEDDWYYDAVSYVCGENMMNGTGSNTFSPNSNITRGMIVTILHRLEKEPEATGNVFGDVQPGMYYAEAVAWAVKSGIVNGYGNGIFAPDEPITREQLAAILYRYADYISCNTAGRKDLIGFVDAGMVSTYALVPVQWAVESGLMNGVGENMLQPGGTATRAQAATILMRFCEDVME